MTRSELTHMIDLAKRLLAAGEPGVLSTLFTSNGSTYRPLGSMMVSGPPALLAGGISGGCLEQYVARTGRSLTQQQPAAMLSFDADPDHDDGAKPVLGCGGSIEVLVERLTVDHVAFLESFHRAIVSDEPSLATCTIDVCEDQASNVSRSWTQTIDRHCTEHVELADGCRMLVHYIPPMTRLVIFGAGDDVQPLCTMARGLGWNVTVVDRRARLATASRFADADQVIGDDWAAAVEQIKFAPHTAAVLMTHSLVDDIEILPLLQDKPMFYVGSLGPEHRREWLIDGALKTMNLSETFVANFRGPIGLNLGDRTATGIAVSITAEIISQLNHRNPTSLSHPKPRARLTQNS
jgi:xanthine dehydrogenase accessory factor